MRAFAGGRKKKETTRKKFYGDSWEHRIKIT